jgi:hypothetical protein
MYTIEHLLEAVIQGDINQVKKCLFTGVDPNDYEDKGFCCIY